MTAPWWDGQVYADCIPCMKHGPGGWLLQARAKTDREGRYMATGLCGGCGAPVEQYVIVQVYECLVAAERSGSEQGVLL